MIKFGTPRIYLAYKTDNWHSTSSYELIYIGEDIEDVIAQLRAYSGMTEEQAEEVRAHRQSQCNNIGYEWDIQEQHLNCFC